MLLLYYILCGFGSLYFKDQFCPAFNKVLFLLFDFQFFSSAEIAWIIRLKGFFDIVTG